MYIMYTHTTLGMNECGWKPTHTLQSVNILVKCFCLQERMAYPGCHGNQNVIKTFSLMLAFYGNQEVLIHPQMQSTDLTLSQLHPDQSNE